MAKTHEEVGRQLPTILEEEEAEIVSQRKGAGISNSFGNDAGVVNLSGHPRTNAGENALAGVDLGGGLLWMI